MAAPTGFTPTGEFVVLTVVRGTGITSNILSTLVGNVEQIGNDVLTCAVGNQVLFNQDSVFSIGTDSWAIVPQQNILGIYIPS